MNYLELCKLEHVKKVYYNGELVCPIEDVSLSIVPGDFFSIEGPSGIGKSTLLYLMAGGILKPTSGKIRFNNRDLSDYNDRELTSWRAKNVGFIFQETNLFPALSALENVELAIYLNKRQRLTQADHKYAVDWLHKIGLGDRTTYLPYQLSIGQRRRVIVCRSIINRPSLILADEPTNDLDYFWAEQVMGILKSFVQEGGSVVMVNHTDAVQHASHRYRLEQGKLVSIS